MRTLYVCLFMCLLLPAPLSLAGKLSPEDYQAVVDEAFALFNGVTDGKNADYIPILATVPLADTLRSFRHLPQSKDYVRRPT